MRKFKTPLKLGFDFDEAKKFLLARDQKEKENLELERKQTLQKVVAILEAEFQNTGVEVFLVGSLLLPYSFTSRSDVDIVLKNYSGDRFDLWTKLEEKIGRNVEVILFEKCPFQEFVIQEGYKVI